MAPTDKAKYSAKPILDAMFEAASNAEEVDGELTIQQADVSTIARTVRHNGGKGGNAFRDALAQVHIDNFERKKPFPADVMNALMKAVLEFHKNKSSHVVAVTVDPAEEVAWSILALRAAEEQIAESVDADVIDAAIKRIEGGEKLPKKYSVSASGRKPKGGRVGALAELARRRVNANRSEDYSKIIPEGIKAIRGNKRHKTVLHEDVVRWITNNYPTVSDSSLNTRWKHVKAVTDGEEINSPISEQMVADGYTAVLTAHGEMAWHIK